MILGPIMGTFVYYHFGIEVAIAIMGVCFVLSALVLTFLPADRKMKKEQKSHPHIFLPKWVKVLSMSWVIKCLSP